MPASVGSTSAFVQLRALVGLRLIMVRSRRGQVGFLLLALVVPLSMAGAALGGQLLSDELRFDLSLLGPTIFLGFAALSVLSPLSAGGGQDLYPAEQLVGYPVRASTQFLSGLAVLPLNLAWLAQLLAVVASAFLLLDPSRWTPLAALVLGGYVLAVSAAGQLVTWCVIGLRSRRAGRYSVWAVAAMIGVGTIVLVHVAGVAQVLDQSPTTSVVVAVLEAGTGSVSDAVDVAAVVVVLATACLAAGWRACAWALHRPGATLIAAGSRPRNRRPRLRLVDVDRASVWRSESLRRGLLVLGVLPGGIAAVLRVDWTTLVILPGLVAAGAGLLFGVNAFCLDGTGAVWLASLPHSPAAAIRAKTRVLAETVLLCVLIAVVVAALRADRAPTAAELNGLIAASLVATACVVGTCLRLSTTRPHRAELRGPRDTPAPPGSMAVYSARLAVGGTLLGLLLSGAAQLGVWWLPWALALPAALLATRQVVRAWARWDDVVQRSGIVLSVASG